jgi:hypothetical protein
MGCSRFMRSSSLAEKRDTRPGKEDGNDRKNAQPFGFVSLGE